MVESIRTTRMILRNNLISHIIILFSTSFVLFFMNQNKLFFTTVVKITDLKNLFDEKEINMI